MTELELYEEILQELISIYQREMYEYKEINYNIGRKATRTLKKRVKQNEQLEELREAIMQVETKITDLKQIYYPDYSLKLCL